MVAHGAGILNHTTGTGGTAYLDGLETAASAASGYPVVNLDDIRPDSGWRAADADPANTRLLYRLAKRQSVGAIALPGLEELTGKDAACRVRLGHHWMEKPAAPLIAGSTVVDITETESWTFILLFRLEGLNLRASTDDIAEIRNPPTTSTSTTRLVQFAVGAAGNLLARLERFGGSTNEEDFTSGAQIDDAAWHVVACSFDGSGGGPFTATYTLDGTVLGTDTTTETLAPETVCLAVSGNHHVAQLGLFDYAMTATDLARHQGKLFDGREIGLVRGLNFSETTGTAVAEINSNGDLTLGSSGTWRTAQNPFAQHTPAAAPRHQPWRRRNYLRLLQAGGGTVATGATDVATSPLVDVMFWFRLPAGVTTSTPFVLYFGDAFTATNYDWAVSLNTAGAIQWRGHRKSADVTLASGAVDDGADHTFHATIGWAGAMTLAIDGVEVATGTASAYVEDTSTKFTLHTSTGDYEIDIAMLLISRRLYSHAEAEAILRGTAPIIPTPSTDPEAYLFYHFHEGTGATVDNAGSADVGGGEGDLTITSSSATWDVDGLDNPAPGPQVGTLADRVNQCFWELAPGVNYDCLEILVELYDPEAATLTIYSLYALEVSWPAVGSSDGQDAGAGPVVQMGNASRTPFADPDETGRALAYTFPKLSQEDAENLSHHVLDASRTWRNGATSAMRPIALIYRTTDRQLWPKTCAIILPTAPREVIDGSQSASWERALQIGGPELRYGA